jgi:hypothetical protein
LNPEVFQIPLKNGLRIQIIPTVEDLPGARKHQFAAYIASEQLLVVWDDKVMDVISRAKDIETELMQLVWRAGLSTEQKEDRNTGPAAVPTRPDEETAEYISHRPTNILNAVLVSLTLVLVTAMLGAGFRQITIEILIDKGWARLAFLALLPVQVFFTLVLQTIFMTERPLI